MTTITLRHLQGAERTAIPAKLFGVRFLWIESFVFDSASSLSETYDGGQWEFFQLSNGGFLMAPTCHESYQVVCANGYEGSMSARAFGITSCLYAYSSLSFSPEPAFGEACAEHFHWLRDLALQHTETREIMRAID